jgi:hypothetical protein
MDGDGATACADSRRRWLAWASCEAAGCFLTEIGASELFVVFIL